MTDDELTPDALAKSRRDLMLSLKQQDFARWKHNPITAAYLQYLDDMIEMLRGSFADVLESGNLSESAKHIDCNPHAMRGQLHALRQLRDLNVSLIHRFYGKEEPDENGEERVE